MLARLLLGLLLAGALAAPAHAEPASSGEHASARKPKKKKSRSKKSSSSRHRKKKRQKDRAKDRESDEAPEITVVGIDPVDTAPPASLVLGAGAGMPDVPRPPEPAPVDTSGWIIEHNNGGLPRKRDRGPTWFFGVRVGPGVIDRQGYYDFRSNRQTYHDERNVRGELTFGRYLGRHVSLGLVAGAGPFPKFDALDPLYEENTRFSVFPFHARLDLDAHAAWFVIGVGAGVAYEHTTGSFQTRDDVTLMIVTHTATFKRRGITAAARTGVQGALGPFTFELLAEIAAVKLDRGTYVHEVESPGLSDDELGYAGSLMLGVKLQ